MRLRATCINVKSIFRCGCYLRCFDGYFSLFHEQRASRKCQNVLKIAKKIRAQGKLARKSHQTEMKKTRGILSSQHFYQFFSLASSLFLPTFWGKITSLEYQAALPVSFFFRNLYFYLSPLADGSEFSENCGFFHEFSGYTKRSPVKNVF